MIALLSPARVRAMDERAIESGTGSLVLMERAAAALAHAVLGAAGRSYGLRVALLCGKGNNGGDGLAAARRLLRAGAAPEVWLAAPVGQLSPDASAQLARWRAAGGTVVTDLERSLATADIAVDCLLGTGAGGPPRGTVARAIDALDAADVPVVACDVPSGVDAATGQVPGAAVRADVTLVVGAHKLGLRLWPARGYCGLFRFADIGLAAAGEPADATVLEAADVARLLPPPGADSEKRTRGVVLVVAGTDGMAGAAVLAARGALAAGAGLVTVATAESVRGLVAQAVPAALTVGLPGRAEDAAKLLAEHVEASDAVVYGPGRGLDPGSIALARTVVATCRRPLVLDADGLNAFRHDGEALRDHAASLLVLTPHRRELERLTGDAGIWGARAEALPGLARGWGAVVVAKGPGSLIASPEGELWVNDSGGPALATGGTGDVLSGVLGALLARHPAARTVAAGVHLHGLAGEIAGRRRSVRAAGPLDVVEALGDAWRDLEEAA